MADARLRAVIADDDPFARRVVKDVLEHAGVIVVAEARDGQQAVELTLRHLPDVVMMDVVMPGSTASWLRAGSAESSPSSS